jgi:cold shock CspA family protein
MRGTMLWFNADKDYGFVSTEEGERLLVRGTSFAGGVRPEGRCAGMDVTFEVAEDGEDRQAKECTLVEKVSPRRARVRRGGARARP